MKTTLLFTGLVALSGCYSSRDAVQADFTNAELVRIDTVYRHPRYQKVLTWRTAENVQYNSFAKMNEVYTVGSKVAVLIKR